MSFSERLKEARKSKNISQQEFADKLGISINSVANYERGTSFPKEDYLYKIIRLLGTDPNYLFQDEVGIESDLWLEESNLINKYRSVDQRERHIINSLVSIDMEKDIIHRLEREDQTLKYICVLVKHGPYGVFAYADDQEKLTSLKVKSNADFSVIIKGRGLESVFNDGSILSVKYVSELEERQVGIFNIGGYAVVATRRDNKLINMSGRKIVGDFYDTKSVLLGRIFEYHKME